MTWKRVAILSLVLGLGVGLGSANAVPILDAGWAADQIDDASTDSEGSPYVVAPSTGALFRITDQFIVGDQYFVYDFGTLILTTSLSGAQPPLSPIGDPTGEAGWESAIFQHGEILLAAGPHSITIQGDGVGGLPAGFYTRLDSVPEPASLLLLGSGLLGLIRARRRR